MWIVDFRSDGDPGLVFGQRIECGIARGKSVRIDAVGCNVRVPEKSPDIVIKEEEALPGLRVEHVLQSGIFPEAGREKREAKEESGRQDESP